MSSFQDLKKKQFAKLDKSSIGSWDKKISGLCNKINKSKSYYTTSSCSGRIVLIKSSEVKVPDIFLFRTHDKISFIELNKAWKKISYNGLVDFQQTTCILHVACADLNSAQALVDKAKFVGWKRSGIMATRKRIIVELNSTENISFPMMNKGQMLVDDDFLKLIVKEANLKLIRVWKKIEKLRKIV